MTGISRTVLVTGGAGFVGSRLVRRYLDAGVTVRVVDTLTQGSIENLGALREGLEILELDICDRGRLADAVAGHDLVVHAAAVIRATTANERALQRRVNVEGTRSAIDACRRSRVPRLVHVSTTAAIGISVDPTTPVDERFEFNLGHLGLTYNSTKHHAEDLVLAANGSGLETVVVNPGFVFGSHLTGYQGSSVIDRILGSRVVPCTNGGLSVVHIDDVVEGIRRVAESGRAGERYILSGENLTFREIADRVCRVFGLRRRVIQVPDAVRDLAGVLLNRTARVRGASPHLYLDRDYAYQLFSSAKAAAEVGYRARPFVDIVEDYARHVRERRLRCAD